MITHTLTLQSPPTAYPPERGRTRLAVCADFHSANRKMPVDLTLARLAAARPDLILCPGDFFSDTAAFSVRDSFNQNGLRLLEGAAGIAPVFFSIGNHERGLSPENRAVLEAAGVTVLQEETVRRAGFVLGGCSSACPTSEQRIRNAPPPDTEYLRKFAGEEGFRILLCHHPEYWEPYIAPLGIELTVSGHAHGGQWRIFGRGIFAPGQGLFPKYTSGLCRLPGSGSVLAVSRGMTNSVPLVPRFFNPCEILVIDLVPGDIL